MKKTVLLFLLILSTRINAQLTDCSDCDTITYSSKDIVKNSLYDLQLLRNEIFARHQYIFKDERLLAYFQDYQWYQPDYNNPSEITLNDIENANIALFKKGEERIKKEREKLFSELKELKRVLKQNDTITINLFFDDALPDYVQTENAVKELNEIFSVIDLKNVNWYKHTALYKVSLDNGYAVSITYLKIEGDTVKLSTGSVQHSEIITEPFQYGSKYYSESEYTSFWIFKFDGNQLRLDEYQFAG